MREKNLFKNSKLCFNCFGKHFINDCHSERRCPLCNGKHQASLQIKFEDRNNHAPSKVVNAITTDDQILMLANKVLMIILISKR